MPEPGRKLKNKPYYVMDLKPASKLRLYFLSASAGGVATIATKVIGGLLLPEAAVVVLCFPAFVETAEYTANRFMRPQDLVLRETQPPRFQL